jgi:hypothetical protein
VADFIKKYAGDTPVFPIFGFTFFIFFIFLGNHECFPADYFDTLNSTNNNYVTNNSSETFSKWLTPEAKASLKDRGFYSMKHPTLNLKIISLNTQVCDTDNFYLLKNSTDPNQ